MHHLVAPVASAAAAVERHRLRRQGVADAVLVALVGDELEEEVAVRETPAHVGAVLSLLAEHEHGQPVAVGEALDRVVHRVRQQAASAVAATVAASLRDKTTGAREGRACGRVSVDFVHLTSLSILSNSICLCC